MSSGNLKAQNLGSFPTTFLYNGEKEKSDDRRDDFQYGWDLTTVLAEVVQCDARVVENVVSLLDDDNTIPFIARYRKEQTNGMEPEKLREVKDHLDQLREVRSKIDKIVFKMEKEQKLDPKLKTTLLSSRTIEEVDHLYAPFKQASKRTLAERARECDLESYARQIISSSCRVNLSNALDIRRDGLSTLADIESGVRHIIADIMAKEKDTIDIMIQTCKTSHVTLCSKHSKIMKAAGKTKSTNASKSKVGGSKPGGSSKISGFKGDVNKFDQYSNFCCPVKLIKPHQMLAINRGESQKVLMVTFDVPESVKKLFMSHIQHVYIPRDADISARHIIMAAAEDAYKRLVLPLLIRLIRSELNQAAEKASVSVFVSNLKNLLLTRPVRCKPILGIDPGFSNGCKYALISFTGKVEKTGVAYLHGSRSNFAVEANKLKDLLLTYRCETIAIGNGVGCRETESFFSDCIQRSLFHPLTVVFCIVNESGASIYSASDEAIKEMPDLDITVRGAVSIARRLQDPLAELVKIGPKNIGVGMYQHDISNKKLEVALNGVVEDCVSFVGVDLNNASDILLRHVSGIGASMALKIIKYRETKGYFINRSQLQCVPGLGPKTYKQCAGFLRVSADQININGETCCEDAEDVKPTVGTKRKITSKGKLPGKKKLKTDSDCMPNELDRTWIHPESYFVADKLIVKAGLQKDILGDTSFIQGIKSFVSSVQDMVALSEELSCSVVTLQQIAEGLMQSVGYDIRDDHEKPLFKKCVKSMLDLKVGTQVTGKVTNVTHFGAFVDIGVGKDALLHVSGVQPGLLPLGRAGLALGDVVEAVVTMLEMRRERIGLRLVRLVQT